SPPFFPSVHLVFSRRSRGQPERRRVRRRSSRCRRREFSADLPGSNTDDRAGHRRRANRVGPYERHNFLPEIFLSLALSFRPLHLLYLRIYRLLFSFLSSRAM